MREIKFRAWDIEDKVMYYSEKEESDGEGIIVWVVDYNGIHFEKIGLFDTNPGCNGHVQEYKYFKPGQKIMQFTGLKDRSDKDIYEGDIVRFGYIRDDYIFDNIGYVYYAEDRAMFYIAKLGFEQYNISAITEKVINCKNRIFEVIGNIHENLELIKD